MVNTNDHKWSGIKEGMLLTTQKTFKGYGNMNNFMHIIYNLDEINQFFLRHKYQNSRTEISWVILYLLKKIRMVVKHLQKIFPNPDGFTGELY